MDRTAVMFILLISALFLFDVIPTIQEKDRDITEGSGDNQNYAMVRFEEGLSIECEVADSEPERVKGLMDRPLLEDYRGMLFVYEEPQSVSLWMKDTYIDLDIVFISDEAIVTKVVEADAGAGRSDSELELYGSDGDVKYVLEMNQGLSDNYGIGPGSKLEIIR